MLLEAFNEQRNYDIDNINGYLETSVRVTTRTVFHKSLPKVEFIFSVQSSSVYRIEIGRTVKGTISSGLKYPVGDTPIHLLDLHGREKIISLNRGERKELWLEQITTPDVREGWICHKLNEELVFKLDALFISVDILDPRDNCVVGSSMLTLPTQKRVRFFKILDWDWQDYDETIKSIQCIEDV